MATGWTPCSRFVPGDLHPSLLQYSVCSDVKTTTYFQLLTPYLAQFDQYLLSPSTCTAVLNIYMSLISQGRAHALAPFHSTLSKACQQPAFNGNLATIYKVGCSVALLFKTASLWLWNIDLDLGEGTILRVILDPKG